MFLFGKKEYFKPGPDGNVPVIAFVGKSQTIPVYEVPAVLGRGAGQVDVVLDDATVSRTHLYIGTYEDKLTVTDQGSTVGTVINGETLEPGIPYYLSEGDKVSIGKLNFVCHINKERTGKRLKLPTFMEKDTSGDTSEMSKSDIAEAEQQVDAAVPDAEPELEAAAEVVKDAEQASGPVIKLMPDPVLEEQEETDDSAGPEEEQSEPDDPVSELESMGLEFSDDAETEEARDEAAAPKAEAGPDGEQSGALEEAPEESAQPQDEQPAETIDVLRGEHARVSRPKFVYYSGDTAVETFEISATPFVVGRAKADYTPGAAGVSRKHCFIDRTGNTFFITDLESTNGVWINGRRIKPYNRTALENGDIVGIGDRVYKFEQN